MNDSEAQRIMNETRDGYNAIADHFALTRNKFWVDGPILARFAEEGDRVLDAGCGTGRLAPCIIERGANYTGCDNAERIIEKAKLQYGPRGAAFVAADLAALPFADEAFDVVMCIAALHHMPSHAMRQRVMRELCRTAASRIVITVWNLHATYYREKFSISDDDLARGDMMLPWHAASGELLMNRYVHAFDSASLEKNAAAGGCVVERITYINHGETSDKKNGHNILMVLTKPKNRGTLT